MKIVFDTNVLISAFLTTTGPSQHVLSLALKRHAVILSEYILEEFERKLIHKFGISHDSVEKTIVFLRKRTIVLNVKQASKIEFPDKKDIPILVLLEKSQAHYFVTGDKRLLELKKWGATLVLTPREAMQVLEQSA